MPISAIFHSGRQQWLTTHGFIDELERSAIFLHDNEIDLASIVHDAVKDRYLDYVDHLYLLIVPVLSGDTPDFAEGYWYYRI